MSNLILFILLVYSEGLLKTEKISYLSKKRDLYQVLYSIVCRTFGVMAASVHQYRNDFESLLELRDLVINDLKSHTSGKSLDEFSVETLVRPCGLKARIVYPHGMKHVLKLKTNKAAGLDSPTDDAKNHCDATPYFVGFFGNMDIKDEKYKTLVWESDDALIQELRNHEYIVAYLSGESESGGDWYNLVLMNAEAAIGQWHNSDIHSNIVRCVNDN